MGVTILDGGISREVDDVDDLGVPRPGGNEDDFVARGREADVEHIAARTEAGLAL